MNGKYFVPPPRDGSNFKELFKRLATAGAGRPADENGFPSGPWTPELLTEAITQIDANQSGIDLRTVQLWFQENEKGISADSIRWLARVFGCGDPAATSEWQVELSAAQSRLTAQRRENRKKAGTDASEPPDSERPAPSDGEIASTTDVAAANDAKRSVRRPSLAMRSEAIFSRGSPLDLPASVFAGAVALGFLSYLSGVHNVTYGRADGLTKQVGFLWAPNWTLLFMVFMPLFFAFVVELVVFWKDEGRSKFLPQGNRMRSDDGWIRRVEESSYTYWAVFLICLAFAGLFQWIGVRLIPLMNGDDNYATDWGSLALVRPEIISVPQAITFTGLTYLYMCLCFYLFFVGLILLYTLAHDLWKIGAASRRWLAVDYQHEINEVVVRVIRGIFRCTVLGILIAMCMKLQSFYLTSDARNILAWMLGDFMSVLYGREEVVGGRSYSMPNHYTSLLIAMAACVVFLYGFIRLGMGSRFQGPLGKMTAAVALVAVSYLLIGAFPGFSILLGVGVLIAIYGLFDPGFGTRQERELGDNQDVL